MKKCLIIGCLITNLFVTASEKQSAQTLPIPTCDPDSSNENARFVQQQFREVLSNFNKSMLPDDRLLLQEQINVMNHIRLTDQQTQVQLDALHRAVEMHKRAALQ